MLGSESHGQGVPQRPGLASVRNRLAIREHERETEADFRRAIYIQPLGGNRHLVRNFCNDTVYRVTSRAGLTFTPGSEVVLGSNTGHPGEFIVSEPAGGQRGASAQGQVAVLRSFGITAEVEADPCDLSYHLGHEYTAIGGNFSTGALAAWLYVDGDYASDLSTISLTGADVSNMLYACGYIYGDSLVADHSVVWVKTTHQQKMYCWEVASGAVHTLNLPNSTSDITIGWAYLGGWIYYVRRSSSLWKLRKVRADMTGDVAVSTLSRTSDAFDEPMPIISSSQINILAKLSSDPRIVSMPLNGSAGAQGDARDWSGIFALITRVSYDVGARGRQLIDKNGGLDLFDAGDTGDAIAHYPASWIGGPASTQACAAPTPDRSAWVAYKPPSFVIGAEDAGIFRWPTTPDPDGHCPAPIIPVEQHAAVDPLVMLPRD